MTVLLQASPALVKLGVLKVQGLPAFQVAVHELDPHLAAEPYFRSRGAFEDNVGLRASSRRFFGRSGEEL
jgi:hypothetical protein